ncbi:hypothetical protein NECAME_18727 [Necator americanus]|uniref:Uncharacterized protein n=1 Tax=Necator americanus TaxID=51031 RepID=W2ST20_NECAM|nr:hypothetical protein NECAME_18727 [Necator americanus]ETN72668.1 hypothetical protein NECAME_18727 [Necator americanus]
MMDYQLVFIAVAYVTAHPSFRRRVGRGTSPTTNSTHSIPSVDVQFVDFPVFGGEFYR